MSPLDTVPFESAPEPIDPSPNPEALAIEHETHEHIRALLRQVLSAESARVMAALYVDDLTAQDVANQCELSLNRVNYIRRMALKVLRTNADIRALLLPTATI